MSDIFVCYFNIANLHYIDINSNYPIYILISNCFEVNTCMSHTLQLFTGNTFVKLIYSYMYNLFI